MECLRCHFINADGRSACEKCGELLPSAPESSQTKTLEISTGSFSLDSLVAGRYLILEELGSGGMGKVYKVVDQETRETLALKLFRSDIVRDERAVERFRNELKIAHQLSHKNICRMYHLGRDESSLFIIMEYIPGEDLKSFIHRSGQLTAGKALFLARQVCEGLGEAHRMGIVHRDLKPQNIMIDRDGNAKIMDFGIARSFQEEGLTRAGYAVGTPTYMAPEQVDGKGADEQTDIYSLGVVLYEMVTGRPPFEGDTEFSIAYKHLNVQPAHPASLNPLIPEEMSRIILQCLEKDKSKRFRSAADLGAALDRVERTITGTSWKTRMETSGRGRLKKTRAVLAVSAFIVAAIALLFVVYLIRGPGRSRSPLEGTAPVRTGWVNSIAVLPFEDLSPDRSLEYICESLTDNIATKLGSTGALKVPSRRSTRRFADQEKDSRDIGRELGVATLLEASLQVYNGQRRVNATLVRAQDGVSVWSRSYSRTKEDILMLEDEISRDVALELGVEFTAENRERLKRKDPKDDRDYDVFLLGRHFEKRYSDYDEEEDFERAVENLRTYVKTHPDYALAYWSLGNAYEHRFALKDDPDDENFMRFYYEKAYHLDPGLEETNLGMGWVSFYRRDFDESYEYFRKAVALGPDNSEVNWNIGSFFRSIGLDEKAIVYYERALVMDPLNPSIYWLCAASYMYIGQYERGLSAIETAVALDRGNFDYLALSARLLLLLERFDEAEKRLAEAPQSVGSQRLVRPLQALIAALKGDRAGALSLLQESRPLDRSSGSVYDLNVSGIYSLLGMKTEALQAIEEGIKSGFADTKMELYSYPLLRSYRYFENLRSFAPFRAVEGKQKEIYEMRREKYKDL
jgi:serine/threonine protein kinase/Tfp pilus assembly protein PilF